MKKAMSIVLLAILIFLLSGCSSRLDAGTIISKQYEPSHRLYQPMVMIINKRTTIIPRWVNIPDKWFITIQSEQETDIWQVSKSYYQQVEIGDYVEREMH